jgi:hypothetical protein
MERIRTPATVGPSPFESSQGVAPDSEWHAEHQIETEAILDSIRLGEDGSP